MHQTLKPLLTTFLASVILCGCSFVDTIPGGEEIILAKPNSHCQSLGQSTVSVIDEFLLIDRNEETIEDELQTLAQNAAVRMGGNAIWPISEVKDGERSYKVLDCKQP